MAVSKSVTVAEFAIKEVVIPIKGISPLITHAWSQKSIKMIEDKQQGVAKSKKHDIRNPQEDYEAGKHISSQGWDGFPAAGFKAAMIRGAKMIGMVMKDTQTSFFIKADDEISQLVRIYGQPQLRKDMVRVGMGSSDVRYRPEYLEWEANLIVEFNEGVISLDQVYQLVKAAGYGCGIGEMRPEKTKFNYGRFALAQELNAPIADTSKSKAK